LGDEGRALLAEWRQKMVSMWWVAGAFLAGGYIGFLLFALLAVARDSETARERERTQRLAAHSAARQAASAN
jgi:hypothetical protein